MPAGRQWRARRGHAVQALVPPVVRGHAEAVDGRRVVHHLPDLLFERHAGDEVLDPLARWGRRDCGRASQSGPTPRRRQGRRSRALSFLDCRLVWRSNSNRAVAIVHRSLGQDLRQLDDGIQVHPFDLRVSSGAARPRRPPSRRRLPGAAPHPSTACRRCACRVGQAPSRPRRPQLERCKLRARPRKDRVRRTGARSARKSGSSPRASPRSPGFPRRPAPRFRRESCAARSAACTGRRRCSDPSRRSTERHAARADPPADAPDARAVRFSRLPSRRRNWPIFILASIPSSNLLPCAARPATSTSIHR